MEKEDWAIYWDGLQRDMRKEMQKDLGYEMRFLREDALAELLELEDLIGQALPNPEVFHLHDEAFFGSAFCLPRAVLGAVAGQELIAYSIIRLPGVSKGNLGRDIGLAEEELCRVAHLQAIAVHPSHRGRGLQQRMTAAHLRVIEELGCDHVCCTVSPRNPVSLRNYLCSGLMIRALCPMFKGWWRYIMHRTTLPPAGMRDASGMEMVRISSSDIAGQRDLLRSGFVGISLSMHPDGVEISYAKV